MSKRTLGFLGFGEAAYAAALGLKGKECCTVYAYDHHININEPPGFIKNEKAKKSNAKLVDNIRELAGISSYIFSTVTPAAAETVAIKALEHISEGKVFLDFNSTAPEVKNRLEKNFSSKNVCYIDCALLNSMAEIGLDALILASGGTKEALNEIADLFNIKWIGEKAGQAAAVKMCQSIVSKGYMALLWEQSLLAKSWDIEEHVIYSMSNLFDNQSFNEWYAYALTSSIIHSGRRSSEMEMVIKTLEKGDLPSKMSTATKDMLSWISSKGARESAQGKRPASAEEAIELIWNSGNISE